VVLYSVADEDYCLLEFDAVLIGNLLTRVSEELYASSTAPRMEAARSPETVTICHSPRCDLIRNLFGGCLYDVRNAEALYY